MEILNARKSGGKLKSNLDWGAELRAQAYQVIKTFKVRNTQLNRPV